MTGQFIRRFLTFWALIGACFWLIGLPLLYEGLTKETSDSIGLVVVGTICAVGGAVFLGIAGFKAWRGAWLVSHGRRALAEILSVEIAEKLKINDRHPRYLRYAFTLPASGQRVEGESHFLSEKEEARWTVGGQVRVAYHPEDPRVSVVLPDQT